LAALVSVKNLGLAELGQRLFHCIEAKRHLHRDRQAPRQHAAREPIHHGRQVDKAACHGNVGDVHRPNLVRPIDLQTTQQVGIDLVARPRSGRIGPPIQRLDAHPPHQSGHQFSSDGNPLRPQHVAQHAAAGERIIQMQLVDPPHDRKLG
jgi:hypothetical protein